MGAALRFLMSRSPAAALCVQIEVAHEALLRREPIATWLEAQKDALRSRDNVLKEAEDWEGRGAYGRVRHAEGLVRRGERLKLALDLAKTPDFKTALKPAKDYLAACQKLEAAGKRGARRAQATIYTLMLGVIAGLVGYINQDFLKEQYQWRVVMQPSVLKAELEKQTAATPGSEFKDCANGCPAMIVVPPGKFMMGSPETEKDRSNNEVPQHEVTITKTFAVGKYDVTFGEWDTCIAAGACPNVSDNSWGRGDSPIISVSWEEARGYVTWLKRMTGQDYRLLSEAEWEYAARAGTATAYSFGDDPKQLGDYAWYSKNSDSRTQPVGKKKPNELLAKLL